MRMRNFAKVAGHLNRGVVVLHDGLLPDLNSASLVARANVDFIGGRL